MMSLMLWMVLNKLIIFLFFFPFSNFCLFCFIILINGSVTKYIKLITFIVSFIFCLTLRFSFYFSMIMFCLTLRFSFYFSMFMFCLTLRFGFYFSKFILCLTLRFSLYFSKFISNSINLQLRLWCIITRYH